MSFVASASRIVKRPRAECFAKFIDYPSWKAFMPRSFAPLRGPSGTIERGSKILVRIKVGLVGIPALLDVIRLEKDREITWKGGVPGVMTGEHSFFFESESAESTLIRSEELWSGVLTNVSLVERGVRKEAERLGAKQLESFASWIESGA